MGSMMEGIGATGAGRVGHQRGERKLRRGSGLEYAGLKRLHESTGATARMRGRITSSQIEVGGFR